jgi:hypothetical protein
MRSAAKRLLIAVVSLSLGAVVGYCTTGSLGLAAAPDSAVIAAPTAPRLPAPATSVVASGAAASWRDNASPQYDPSRAASYWQIDLFELFQREPRNGGFATRREEFLRRVYGGMLDRLAPGSTIDELECRTATCVIQVSLPDDDWSHDVVSWLPWGDRRRTTDVVGPEGRRTVEILAAYSSETRAHDYFEQVAADVLGRMEIGLIELHAKRRAEAGDAGPGGD